MMMTVASETGRQTPMRRKKKMRLTERDEKILRHIARYRATFNEILRVLFFAGDDISKVIGRLKNAKLIEAATGFVGKRSAYRLTRDGARAVGVNWRATKKNGPAVAPFDLAVYGFCFLAGRSCIRLERDELKQLLGFVPNDCCRCLESGKYKGIHEVYAPEGTVSDRAVARNTRDHMAKSMNHDEVCRWMSHRLYRFTILVNDDARRKMIDDALEETDFDGGRRLRDLASVDVATVPSLSTLEEALRVLA
jgi:hypothetical protein